MVDRQKQQTITKHRIQRMKSIGTAALGIPMAEYAGETRHFTGTKSEAKEFVAALDKSEIVDGFHWMNMGPETEQPQL
jgi:hypothetical protein